MIVAGPGSRASELRRARSSCCAQRCPSRQRAALHGDGSSLKPSRFLLEAERRQPYRDENGKVHQVAVPAARWASSTACPTRWRRSCQGVSHAEGGALGGGAGVLRGAAPTACGVVGAAPRRKEPARCGGRRRAAPRGTRAEQAARRRSRGRRRSGSASRRRRRRRPTFFDARAAAAAAAAAARQDFAAGAVQQSGARVAAERGA